MTTVSERAAKLREKYFPIKMGEYEMKCVSVEEKNKVLDKIFSRVFPPRGGYQTKYGSKEFKKLEPCINEYKKIHSENFIIYHRSKPVGWFMGEMEDFETFYLRNSGILPDHQGKKIGQKGLQVLIKYLTELGYARISSQHQPHNKNVFKLMFNSGFLICGNENHERWGHLIKMIYFTDKKRFKLFKNKFCFIDK